MAVSQDGGRGTRQELRGSNGFLARCLGGRGQAALPKHLRLMRSIVAHTADEGLMSLVSKGDDIAFEELVQRHMKRAIRTAQAVVGNPADADEIAQEAFLLVWNKAETFDPTRSRFSTWMYRIIVNRALDMTRRRRIADGEPDPETPSDAQTPLEELIQTEDERQDPIADQAQEGEIVKNAVAGLNQRQRTAVALFHFEGLSVRDCADAMDVSEAAVESLLSRARASLRNRLSTGPGKSLESL